jgi:hypothetical protein
VVIVCKNNACIFCVACYNMHLLNNYSVQHTMQTNNYYGYIYKRNAYALSGAFVTVLSLTRKEHAARFTSKIKRFKDLVD